MIPNEGKALAVTLEGRSFARIPIKTHVVMPGDELAAVVETYAREVVQPGDIFFITEKIVAITQGRSYRLDEIAPRRLATLLSRRVTKTSFGIGLGIPETMEMALRECGTPRILFAAAVSAVTKLFGRSGDFYRVAGDKARAIDGPTHNTIPPYNEAVVLGPENPRQVAADVRAQLGDVPDLRVAIVDINDLGGNILGSTMTRAEERQLAAILRDNPLGQGHQSTPMGVVRPTAS